MCGLGGVKGKSQKSFWFNFSEAVPTLNDIRCLWLIGRIKVHQTPWLSALCWVALMIKALGLLDCKDSRKLNTWPRLVLRTTGFMAKLADYFGTETLYPEKCPPWWGNIISLGGEEWTVRCCQFSSSGQEQCPRQWAFPLPQDKQVKFGRSQKW